MIQPYVNDRMSVIGFYFSVVWQHQQLIGCNVDFGDQPVILQKTK